MKQEQTIQQELLDMESPLAPLPRTMPFELPGNYLATLPDQLTVVAAAQSNTQLPLSTALPHAVPEGYFDTLAAKLLTVATSESGADRLQREHSRKSTISFRRYIIWPLAAILLLAVGMGTFRYLHHPSADRRLAQQLSTIDHNALADYAIHHIDEFDEELLETSLATPSAIQSDIAGLEEEDIRAYLEENNLITPGS